MSKPNINIPAEFAINGTKTDFSQAKITNGFDRLQPDVLPGDNLNKFIDDTYKGLNGVLELFEGCVLYDSTVTYNNKSIVFYINSDDKVEVYRSLINNNLNNLLTDDTAWKKVEMVDISNKADVDLTNVNNSGTSRGASWAMPSGTWIGVALGASGTQYTAPANGWYTFSFKGTSGTNGSLVNNAANLVSSISLGTNNSETIYLPAKKGDIVTVTYSNITNTSLRFTYAQGSESEAN